MFRATCSSFFSIRQSSPLLASSFGGDITAVLEVLRAFLDQNQFQNMEPQSKGWLGAVSSYYSDFGPLIRHDLMGHNEVWVFHPEDMLKSIRKEGEYPHSATVEFWPIVEVAKETKSQTPFFEMNETWKQYRTVMQKDLLPPKAAQSYLPLLDQPARLSSSMAPFAADDFSKLTMHAAMDMFTSIMLGYNPKTSLSLEDPSQVSPPDLKFVQDTIRVLDLAADMFLDPTIWKPEDTGDKWAELRSAWLSVLERARECVAEAKDLNIDHENPPYITRLLKREGLEEKDASEQLGNLLLAGVDTTHHALMWLIVNLAENPDVQEKLREEVTNVLGDGPLDAAGLKNLPYLKMCMRESHRKTPASSFTTFRRLPGDVEIQGYNIPAKTKIVFSMYPFQNDPQYIDNIDEFEPERWSDEAIQQRKGTVKEALDHALLRNPFGYGPRMCLGFRVAELELQAFLCSFVRDWRFKLAPGATYEKVQSTFLKPNPFPPLVFESLKK